MSFPPLPPRPSMFGPRAPQLGENVYADPAGEDGLFTDESDLITEPAPIVTQGMGTGGFHAPPRAADASTPSEAVQALLRATGGDYNARHPMQAPTDDPFYSDSAAAQVNRQRYFGEAGADLDADLADDAAMRQATRALDTAPYANSLADTLSEGAAGRQFLPNATRLHGRQRGDATQDAFARYVQPAQIDAQAKLDAADLGAQGQVAAARERARGSAAAAGVGAASKPRDLVLAGLVNAVQAQIEQGKPVDVPQLQQMFKFLTDAAGTYDTAPAGVR